MARLQPQTGQPEILFDAGLAEAAIRELQQIGGAAADALLTGIAPALPAEFAGLCGWLWRRSNKSAVVAHGVRTVCDRFPFAVPENLSPLGTVLLAGAVPPRRGDLTIDRLQAIWRSMVRRQKEGGAPPGGDVLAEALIGTAYRDVGFRLSVAGVLRRALRSRVLFGPEGPPTVVLAPATVAGLMVARGLPEALPQEVVGALRQCSARMLGAPGWAGFWDVWMLHEALRTSAGAPLPEMLELGGFAERLPEAAASSDDNGENAAADVPEQMRLGWRDTCPVFAGALLNGTMR